MPFPTKTQTHPRQFLTLRQKKAQKMKINEIVKAFKDTDIDVSIPPFKYCTDNAAMIACAGYYHYKTFNETRKLDINGLANMEL